MTKLLDDAPQAISTVPTAPAAAKVFNWQGELVRDGERRVAVETPVQVSFADVPFAVMMLTPSDLEDFAYGFSLTEGMVETVSDIRNVTLRQSGDGLTIRIDL